MVRRYVPTLDGRTRLTADDERWRLAAKTMRTSAGMTMAGAARVIGVSRAWWSAWERGVRHPRRDHLTRFAELTGQGAILRALTESPSQSVDTSVATR